MNRALLGMALYHATDVTAAVTDLTTSKSNEATEWPEKKASAKLDIKLSDDSTGFDLIFRYYTKRLWTMKDGKQDKEKYQFHGDCIVDGIDTSAWVADTNQLNCEFTVYPKDATTFDYTGI